MLTLARLAFPAWRMLPEPVDVAQALHQAITDLDPVRANLLTQVVYHPQTWEVLKNLPGLITPNLFRGNRGGHPRAHFLPGRPAL